MFQDQWRTFQQDYAKTTQTLLQNYLPAFIPSEVWPSGNFNLSPMNYKFGIFLKDMVSYKRYSNIDSLKTAGIRAVSNFPMNDIRAATDNWPVRLEACVKVKGVDFKLILAFRIQYTYLNNYIKSRATGSWALQDIGMRMVIVFLIPSLDSLYQANARIIDSL